MIADIHITEKSFGNKSLYRNVVFTIAEGEKIGLVGRNGVGKSTLLGILDGTDKDFSGDIAISKGVSIVSSRQEHHGYEDKSVISYILEDLPEFAKLMHIIETYPEHMGDNERKIAVYSDALERFSNLGYYHNQERIVEDLKRLQISEDKAEGPLRALSGGQKRLVEVVKIMHSNAQLALMDEPTNHMDIYAKKSFLDWMATTDEAMIVITHDRDVLRGVDKIVEIKDGEAQIYRGNYDQYLRQNAMSTTNAMQEYEVVQRRILNLKDKVINFRRLKEKARDPDTIKQFKRREQTAAAELAELQKVERPSFWIDKSSVESLGLKHGEQYQKYRAKNIKLHGTKETAGHSRLLVQVHDLSLGYVDKILFENLAFELREGERVELRGKNGAGKTTVVRAILNRIDPTSYVSKSETYAGTVAVDTAVRVGLYEQEISSDLFEMNLSTAIEHVYMKHDVSINETKVRQLLGDYLFEQSDGNLPVSSLSGGQKARLQLIAMLANNPNVLILDEPTNHLDLPSIEELEAALDKYRGAILYVSHDSYFQQAIGGKVVQVAPPES